MATSSPPTTGVNLSPAQIAGLIVRNGGRGDGVAIGTAIVLRESGGKSNAFRPEAPDMATYNANPGRYNKPGRGNDRGAIQFNDKAHPEISDADAYDVGRSFAWFARKSGGFTDFGPWDVGPNAYSGVDKLPALQASQHWQTARAAAANPDQSTPSSSADPPPPLGQFEQVRYDALIAKIPGGAREAAELLGYIDQGGTAGIAAKMTFDRYGITQSDYPLLRKGLIAAGIVIDDNNDGIFDNIADVGNQIGNAVGNVTDALTPSWMDALGRLLGNLLDGSFWRRILIVVGGVALIALAVILANRGAITAVASKGAITNE